MQNQIEIATFAGGCFWCIESAFNAVSGIEKALSGYMDGHVLSPTYKDICTGESGHAEVVQVTFDSSIISYQTLVDMFFALHDPTQLNRQGNDIGTQYRSAIYFHNEEQKRIATDTITHLNDQHRWPNTIVTQIKPAITFYCAEDYHQDYVSNNPQNPYCQMLVLPKLAKFKQLFTEKLK